MAKRENEHAPEDWAEASVEWVQQAAELPTEPSVELTPEAKRLVMATAGLLAGMWHLCRAFWPLMDAESLTLQAIHGSMREASVVLYPFRDHLRETLLSSGGAPGWEALQEGSIWAQLDELREVYNTSGLRSAVKHHLEHYSGLEPAEVERVMSRMAEA